MASERADHTGEAGRCTVRAGTVKPVERVACVDDGDICLESFMFRFLKVRFV